MKQKLLEVGAADGRVREVSLNGDEFLIGRGDDCDLALHDPEVSRHHCLIRVRGYETAITDLGSSNGTFINGHRLLSQAKLNTGDEIVVGPFRYIVDLGDDPEFHLPEIMGNDPQAATRTLKDMRRNMGKTTHDDLKSSES
jgi:pSer/pThr/pTyr-binding forkhead associated (FHA) protein